MLKENTRRESSEINDYRQEDAGHGKPVFLGNRRDLLLLLVVIFGLGCGFGALLFGLGIAVRR